MVHKNPAPFSLFTGFHPLPPAIGNTLRDLAVNLRSGVRLALWRPLTLADFRISTNQLALLALVELALTVVTSFVDNGTDGYWDWEALPYVVFPLVLLLVAAFGVAKIYRRDHLALELPIVLLSPAPVFTVFFIAQELLAQQGAFDEGALSEHAIYLASMAWVGVVFCAGLLVVGGRDWRRLTVAAVVLFVGAVLPQAYLPYRDLWAPENVVVEEDDLPSVASEDILELQPRLLDRELAALAPERRGVIDLYFVGFAPYDEQDVFMREVGSARELIEERFDGQSRAVTLVNNRHTLTQRPIATMSHLAAALNRVGEVMNPEEDILFLFLTSHGLPSRLEVRFDPLELRPLYPAALRETLDAAGIKWRVIVISACYSGSFVGPLQDERTLIITAADGDSTSFGCSNDADLTYFGRAFFGEHLKGTYSFEEAYRRAATTIADWEKTKGYPPSRPQMQVGSAIAAKLKVYESRMQLTSAAAAAAHPR